MGTTRRGSGKRVTEGQSVVIGATTWNTLLDVATQFQDELIPGGDARRAPVVRPPSLGCRIQSSVAVAPGGILALQSSSPVTLSTVTGDAAIGSDGMLASPVLNAIIPTITSRSLVVMPEGLAANQIGRAIFQGVTVAQVHNTGASTQWAAPDRSPHATRLATNPAGLIPILHLDVPIGKVGPAIVLLSTAIQNRFDECYVSRQAVGDVQCKAVTNPATGQTTNQLAVLRRRVLVPVAAILSVRTVRPAPTTPPPPPGSSPPPPVPVSSVMVTVTPTLHTTDPVLSGTTDTTGYTLFRVPAGDYRVSITNPPGLTLPPPPSGSPLPPPGVPASSRSVSVGEAPSCDQLPVMTVAYQFNEPLPPPPPGGGA